MYKGFESVAKASFPGKEALTVVAVVVAVFVDILVALLLNSSNEVIRIVEEIDDAFQYKDLVECLPPLRHAKYVPVRLYGTKKENLKAVHLDPVDGVNVEMQQQRGASRTNKCFHF